MKIDRLMGIVIQLLNHDKRTARQLADYFNVSERTIKRDMDSLTLAGIPIYSEMGQYGGYHLMDHYTLKENFLNTSEADILMTFLNGLGDTIPVDDFISLRDKFTSLQDEVSQSEKMVILPSPIASNSTYIKTRIKTLSEAIDKRQKVYVHYIDQDFKGTSRVIHPYTLIMMTTNWYLYAYCELRLEFRLFKLFRIQQLEVLHEHYLQRELPDKKPWSSLYDDNKNSVQVKILLDKKLLGKLPDYIDFKMCKLTEKGIEVTLNFPVDEWLYSFLMGFVPYIKIISPDIVRDTFVEKLRQSLQDNTLLYK